MISLPVFGDRTAVSRVAPQTEPEAKSATFLDGTTHNWTTAAKPAVYRALYKNLTAAELAEVKEFFEAHKLPEFWTCPTPENDLRECYFGVDQRLGRSGQNPGGGYDLELLFFVRYQDPEADQAPEA